MSEILQEVIETKSLFVRSARAKVKLVLRGIKRLKKWAADGNPWYVISTTNVVRLVDVPKELKRKPKPSSFEPVWH